jgi:hypothetical protein
MSGKACAVLVLAALAGASTVAAAAGVRRQHCVRPAVVLWGDGRHDDTKALQAWLDGRDALWGESGAPVGPTIAWREFRLSSAIYVEAGSDRMLEHFRFYWPGRGEVVTGGAIRAGRDPNGAPTMTGVHIVGGDRSEGKPFFLPDLPPKPHDVACGVS